MDARSLPCRIKLPILMACAVSSLSVSQAATYQTANFAVTADRADVAEKVGQQAEVYRRQLAIFWLGQPLPNWSRPCKVSVREGSLGAAGQTTFQFVRGEVLNWRMHVQGTLERILDSVLPHEINHTVFACHFRRPLPRWADEGAATLFEHRSEQLKQLALLNDVIRSQGELITLRQLLSMKDYPSGHRPMLTLYAQGFALADFLVQQRGRQAFLKFIADGERSGWEQAIRDNYDHDGIEKLEKNWRGWVLAGMPKLTQPRDQMLTAREKGNSPALPLTTGSEELPAFGPEFARASAGTQSENYFRDSDRRDGRQQNRTSNGTVVRLQSPDPQPPTTAASRTPLDGGAAPTSNAFFLNDSESETGETNEFAGQLSTVAPQSPRRSTITAPQPTPRKVRDSGTSGAFESSRVPKEPGRDLQSSSSSVFSPDLTLTTMTVSDHPEPGVSGHQILPAARSTLFSDGSTTFPTTLPDKESRVNSESTPQWAGFPGKTVSY